jgi:DNA-binding transcriptional LysR family regulator
MYVKGDSCDTTPSAQRAMTDIESKEKSPGKRGHSGVHDAYLYNWDGLRAFMDVARAGSINEAATALKIQHSTLSRRIDALESDIGRPLIQRTPRGIVLTPDGVELLSVLQRFDSDLSAVGRWITRGVRGMERPISVNISCTEGLSAFWLTKFLPGLRKRNVVACYNIHTALTSSAEQENSFHAIVQMRQPMRASFAEKIGTVHFSAMASRAYVADMGTYTAGEHPGRHRWVEYSPFKVLNGSWESWFQRKKIEVAPFTVTNSLVTTVNAVREGAGIGLLPTYMAVTMPELSPMDVGFVLRFPIWLSMAKPPDESAERNAAVGLIRAAINPEQMPWFRDTNEPSPDYVKWRELLDKAVSRLA